MSQVPGPRGFNQLRFVGEIRKNYVHAYHGLFKEHGNVARIALPFKAMLFFHPRQVRHILKDNAKNYVKSPLYDALRGVLGNGLVTSEGETWRSQRKMMAPEFHLQRVIGFSQLTVQRTEELMRRWDVLVGTEGGIHDVTREMMSVTFKIMGDTLFGADFEQEAKVVGDSLYTVLDQAVSRMVAIVPTPRWMPTPGNIRSLKAERALNGMVERIIRVRRQDYAAGARKHDLLSRLLAARDDAGGTMTDRQLSDEIKTMILAGHETSSLALSWTWYLLSQNPKAEQRLYDEISGVLGRASGSETPRLATYEDLARFPYLKSVLQESMRLYPPIPVVSRTVLEEDEAEGVAIPKGYFATLSAYSTHRHPEFWSEPDEFRPERFSPDKKLDPHSGTYFPFLSGPRSCIGEQFAMVEMQLILAHLVSRFRLRLDPGTHLDHEALTTLRPKTPLKMRIERR